MAQGVNEMLWLRRLLQELGLLEDKSIMLHCDNKIAINIINNLVQHDRTKYNMIELNIQRLIGTSSRINLTRVLCVCILLELKSKLLMSLRKS
jgi:hypothetical protein